ncbi:MAG: hypothetical protein J1F31_06955 [Erysipelotrichales bacterium]|nr:hypothetical protein [Erysipelotrichales bacterium]
MKNKNIFYFQMLIIVLAFSAVSVAFLYRNEIHVNFPNNQIGIILMSLATALGMILSLFMSKSLTNIVSKEKKASNVCYQNEKDINKSNTKDVLKEERSKTEKNSNIVETKKDIEVNILDVQTAFLKMEERLLCELKALGKRSNINLIIGSVIAVIGWGLLILFIYDVNGQELEGWSILNTFLPRLSIVAIMEVFSFFFLKLYRESIERIRYYQNEITNIESKKVAIIVACMLDNENDNKKTIINSLLSVERNVFIKKGETTMELEKYRIDSSSNNNLIKILKELGNGLIPIKNRGEGSQS